MLNNTAMLLPGLSPEVVHERDRLEALQRYDILDTAPEDAFDRIARLMRKVFDVPIALVALIDGHRHWSKACVGLDTRDHEREVTFCNLTIQGHEPLIVPNTLEDERFAQNPFVARDGGIRFYAGCPLTTSDGYNIGTVCIADLEPRTFNFLDTTILVDFGRIAIDALELRRLATVDSLTGTLSRRALREEASRMLSHARRFEEHFSCIAIDLDHFKKVNDTHGHPAGDKVLSAVTKACLGMLRETDRLGRVGGEEFVALLPYTSQRDAIDLAERMRAGIQRLRAPTANASLHVTSSFGIASFEPAMPDFEALLANADAALYQAKATGRNRCVAWATLSNPTPAQTRRVLKAGRIRFNDQRSTIDCTIRTLSPAGAGIDVSSSFGIPTEFLLSIPADGFETRCRVVARLERHIDVAFV